MDKIKSNIIKMIEEPQPSDEFKAGWVAALEWVLQDIVRLNND